MKYSISTLRLLLLLAIPQATGQACELDKKSSWFWDQDELIGRTNQILVAKLEKEEPIFDSSGMLSADLPLSGGSGGGKFTKWTFKVTEVLKGPRDTKSFSITSWKSLGNIIDRAAGSCTPVFTFKKGKSYLIFVDSYHPNGYQIFSKSKKKEIESKLAWARFANAMTTDPHTGLPRAKKKPDLDVTEDEIANAPEATEENLKETCVDSKGTPVAKLYGSEPDNPFTLVVLDPKPDRRFVVKLHQYGELTYRNKDVILSHELHKINAVSHLLVKEKDGSQPDRIVHCEMSTSSLKKPPPKPRKKE